MKPIKSFSGFNFGMFVGCLAIVSMAVIPGCSDGSGTGTLPDSGIVVDNQDSGSTGIDAPAAGGTSGTDAMSAIVDKCSSDKDCTPLGLLCDTRIAKCVQCRNNLECGDNQRCAAGSCQMVTACNNSLDCAGVPNNENICDQGAGECVQCTKAADCPMNHACTGRRCVEFTPCQTSLQCPTGQVCHPSLDRCFECINDADCGSDQKCAGNTCRAACKSDNQCTGKGLLCDISGGFCAACLDDNGCPSSQHCAIGRCEDDVCAPGTSVCNGNSIQTCNASGSGYLQASPCQSRQTCVASTGTASCVNWSCTAGQIECNGSNEVVTCSSDGLKVIARTDCQATGKYCINNTCGDLVCTPSQRHCYQGSVYSCSANGLSRTVFDTCNPQTEYCNASNGTAVCSPLICTPNAPSCNGNQATTCNGQGSGYTGGATDCAQSNKVCVAGSCLDAAVDTILPNATMETTGGTFYGTKYQVTTSRTLVRVEIPSHAISAAQTAIISVYEASPANQNGTYTRVWKSPAAFTVDVGSGYSTYSTGTIAVPLVAGNYYIIGIEGFTSIYQKYDATTMSIPVSFGAAIGYDTVATATDSYNFGSHTTTYMFTQSLYTSAP